MRYHLEGRDIMAIRFALIGAGRIGKFHAQTLSMMPQAELVSISDSQEDVAKEVARQFGAKVSTAFCEDG